MVIIEGPAIVPALLRALCRKQTSTPHHATPFPTSSTSSTSSNHPSPSLEPDINRLHPTNSNPHNQLSNIQASATGLILENPDTVNGGVKARVLIVNNTPERGSGGYVGLMNSVFAAQKRVSWRLHVRMASLRRTDPYYVFLLGSWK
jgi:hypothetical protein